MNDIEIIDLDSLKGQTAAEIKPLLDARGIEYGKTDGVAKLIAKLAEYQEPDEEEPEDEDEEEISDDSEGESAAPVKAKADGSGNNDDLKDVGDKNTWLDEDHRCWLLVASTEAAGGDKPVDCKINTRNFLIERDKWVKVPKAVYVHLSLLVETRYRGIDEQTKAGKPRHVRKFNMEVRTLAQGPGEDRVIEED